MKSLTVLMLLTSLTVYAQNFSPSASGTSVTSPSAAVGGGTFTPGIPNANIGQTTLGDGSTVVTPVPDSTINNQFNTAPSTIPTVPTDNTLINTPSNNPIQAQEFTFPNTDNTISPSGSGSGSGSENSNLNSPITTP